MMCEVHQIFILYIKKKGELASEQVRERKWKLIALLTYWGEKHSFIFDNNLNSHSMRKTFSSLSAVPII